MSADRDVTPALRSWLREDAHENADRVLDLVIAELDTTPQRQSSWLARRFPPMSNAVRITLAAVAVLVIAFLGIRFLALQDTGSPTQTPAPSPAQLPAAGPLEPGGYEMSNPGFTPVHFTFTVPAGWATNSDGFVIKQADKPGELAFTSFIVTHVFGNACHWTGTSVKVGPTVADLASALAGQKERQTSGPVDVTFASYPAKRIELSEPAGFDVTACDNGVVRSWPDAGGDENGGWSARAGQTDVVQVLDVAGKRLVIDAWHFPGASEADITELEGIVASIRFTP